MQTKQIIINQILINYYENLTNSNQSLIFLHGWGSDSIYWTQIFTKEFLEKYNIYCIDLPGFAKSQKPTTDLTVDGYGDFIQEFIKKLQLKNVVLIGHSLGGRISIKLASKGINEIKKIVLVNSAGIYHTSKTTKAITKIAGIIKPVFKLPIIKSLRKPIYRLLKAEDYLASPALQKTFVNVVQEDLTPYLSKISLPTLIIWGEKDDNEYTPLSDGYRMNELIQNSHLVILKDAKHYSFLDKPEEFITTLSDFINE